MPSSGYGSVYLFESIPDDPALQEQASTYVRECAKLAMKNGLFIEWLESFMAAWEKTKNPYCAACAGIQEWDL